MRRDAHPVTVFVFGFVLGGVTLAAVVPAEAGVDNNREACALEDIARTLKRCKP